LQLRKEYGKTSVRVAAECQLAVTNFKEPRPRWEDNIKMDLKEVGCGGMDWIELAQDRDRWRTRVTAVMNLWVSQNAGNFLTS